MTDVLSAGTMMMTMMMMTLMMLSMTAVLSAGTKMMIMMMIMMYPYLYYIRYSTVGQWVVTRWLLPDLILR